MRPPICAICNRRLTDPENSGLIAFKQTFKDKMWKKKSKKKGFVGHPPWKEYFCSEHYEKAQSLSHLKIRDAMDKFEKIKK